MRAPIGLRTKGWGPLALNTTPSYADTSPFPAALTRWKCRAFDHMDDAQVGLWRAEASVTIGG